MRHSLTAAVIALALGIPADTAIAKGGNSCPPGLAKKSPACVPPGLAKKGVTSEDWTGSRSVGDRLDDREFIVLREGDRVIFDDREYIVVDTDNGTVLRRGDDWYRLPRAGDGSDYVRIGDAIVKVNRDTKEVIDVIRLADLILS